MRRVTFGGVAGHAAAALVTLLAWQSSALAAPLYQCTSPQRDALRIVSPSPGLSVQQLEARGCTRLGGATPGAMAKTTAGGDDGLLVVRRSKDGQFRLQGLVNGKRANFIVDTGASMVAVSEEFAAAASLTGGRRVQVRTANGARLGRVVDNVSVTAGRFTLPGIAVSTGLAGLAPDEALLGQNFLAQFEITLDEAQLTMRRKPH